MINNLLDNCLENTKNLYNNIENSILEKQREFLQTNIGQAINTGVDFGIRALLPNCIEDEIIEIKDAVVNNGFKEGVNTAIDKVADLGQTVKGIFTGNFEDVFQIEKAIEKGGVIDTVSDLLDTAIDWAKKGKFIDKSTATILKKGKNVILDSVEDSIESNISNQIKSIEKINTYIENWKEYYSKKDFTNMEKQYKKIKKEEEKIIPLQKVLDETKNVENIHEFIKNNNKDFDLTKEQIELLNTL